jgi:HSP20 family molecular chaperone IbpA
MGKSLCKGFWMSRIANNPLLLGFEEIERMLDRIAKASGDGYPPYNIERIPPSDGLGERLRIVLAVAGFAREHLEIVVEDNQLTIKGKQPSDPSRTYLHRGIATRQFQRSYVLADGLTVLSAELDNGLLSIDLMRPAPSRRVKRIEIKDRA